MIRIENWSIGTCSDSAWIAPECRKLYLQGEVFGHPRHKDGKKVVTSAIVLAAGLYVETYNSRYLLGKPNPEYLAYLESINFVFNPDDPLNPGDE